TVTLFMVNQNKQTLQANRVFGADGKYFKIEISLDTGIAGYVARTGQPAIVNDPYQNSYFNSNIDRETGFRTHNILSLPIIDPQSHEVIAVVQALNKLNNAEFDTEDLERFADMMNALQGVLPDSIDAIQRSFTYL
ncbi:MAG: GAF domain-containing protein, partial [Cyanobacteria bacterium P01_E01_bin.42]